MAAGGNLACRTSTGCYGLLGRLHDHAAAEALVGATRAVDDHRVAHHVGRRAVADGPLERRARAPLAGVAALELVVGRAGDGAAGDEQLLAPRRIPVTAADHRGVGAGAAAHGVE